RRQQYLSRRRLRRLPKKQRLHRHRRRPDHPRRRRVAARVLKNGWLNEAKNPRRQKPKIDASDSSFIILHSAFSIAVFRNFPQPAIFIARFCLRFSMDIEEGPRRTPCPSYAPIDAKKLKGRRFQWQKK